jgi:hypothetical protein
MTALLALILALGHPRGNTGFVLFDNGWQFRRTLSNPLTLDTANAAAATDTSVTHGWPLQGKRTLIYFFTGGKSTAQNIEFMCFVIRARIQRLRKKACIWPKNPENLPQGLKPVLILWHLRHD